jgi:hypothetical protein
MGDALWQMLHRQSSLVIVFGLTAEEGPVGHLC